MKVVRTYSGSSYIIDEDTQTFRRAPGQDANQIDNDECDQKYIEILYLRKDSPMEILWMQDGKEKIRITTPVKEIMEINSI